MNYRYVSCAPCTFIAAAYHGGFSQAGQAIDLSQSAGQPQH